MTTPSLSWFGDRAVAVAVPATESASARAAALAAILDGVEVRVGMRSVLVEAPEPDPGLLARVAAGLDAPAPDTPTGSMTTTIAIPMQYDGADLSAAADALACSVERLVAAHQRQAWTVAMMGFAPGFGYLVPDGASELPWDRVPRLDQPRARVPALSVALAAGMSAVYPTAMPGGWLLLGRSTRVVFDVDDPVAPALLSPGVPVRFVAGGP